MRTTGVGRSLLARIEALEGRGQHERLCVILASFDAGDLRGYAWNGGRAVRELSEGLEALLSRAEREAQPEPWGGIVLWEIRLATA